MLDRRGHALPARGAALLALADSGRCVVKPSGLAEVSTRPPPHGDVAPYLEVLIAACTPRRLVWASDRPFLRAPACVDRGPLPEAIERVLPDEAARRAMSCDGPRRLLGVGEAA